jgi:hypothetical protein
MASVIKAVHPALIIVFPLRPWRLERSGRFQTLSFSPPARGLAQGAGFAKEEGKEDAMFFLLPGSGKRKGSLAQTRYPVLGNEETCFSSFAPGLPFAPLAP